MSFIIQNKKWFRILILILFIISMLGIWDFELIFIRAPYSCDKFIPLNGVDFFRLNNNYCVLPLTGFEIVYLVIPQFVFGTFIGLIKGNFTVDNIPELIIMIGIVLIILPFLTNLLMFHNQYSQQLQVINIIVWGLAGLLATTVFILQLNRDELIKHFYLLWGLWLYVFLTLGTIIFEASILKWNNKSITST